jgi:hypothetical protein
MAQVLIVVERFDLTLFDTLREKYAGVENLTVIRDRRRIRRRRRPQMRYVDRRRADRRVHPELDERLRDEGFFAAEIATSPVPDPLAAT